MPITRIVREFTRPQIDVEPTDFGMRILTTRRLSDASTHIRVTNLLFPHAFHIPLSREMTITQWHVPIDDTRHYWYAIFTSFGAPVDKDEMRRQRLRALRIARLHPAQEQEQRLRLTIRTSRSTRPTPAWAPTSTCTTSGPANRWARSRTARREHLGQSDKAISAYRRILRGAIEEAGNGGRPPMVLDASSAARFTGPAAIDGIGPTDGWQAYWQKTDAVRRKASTWANGH